MNINKIFKRVELAASFSKDPSTKVGAVILPHNSDIPIDGYNGFARKIADTEERLNNRELKYKLVIHAELNAIFNAAKHGVSLENASLYVNFHPCHLCASAIIQAGISTVVIKQDTDNTFNDRWKDSTDLAKELFLEAGIITKYEN